MRRSGYTTNGSQRLSDSWKHAGAWLQELRERRGLTQRQAAEAFGFNTHQQLSSIERGNNRLPVDKLELCSDIYGVDRKTLVKTLMRWYSPYEYDALFGNEHANDSDDHSVSPKGR